jgi:hypothetical protein
MYLIFKAGVPKPVDDRPVIFSCLRHGAAFMTSLTQHD